MKRALFLIVTGVVVLLILDHTAAATGDGDHNPCDGYQGSTWPHHDPCQPDCEEKPWKCQPTTTTATTTTSLDTTTIPASTSTLPAPTSTAPGSIPSSLSPSTTTGSSLPPPVTVTPPTSSVALIPPVPPTSAVAATPTAPSTAPQIPETGFNQLVATVALILLCLGIACFIVQRIWPL